jgi:hypothetical protein
VICGGVESIRVTVNVHELLNPAASVAVIVTVVLPNPESNVPALGLCVKTILVEAVQLSVLVALPR